MTKVLIAVDLRGGTEEVLDLAVPWLQRLNAVADVLFVGDYAFLQHPYLPDGGPSVDLWVDVEKSDRESVEALVNRLPEAHRGKGFLERGQPGYVIPEVARGYDLLLVGTHARTGLGRLLLGSVAERVVRLAPVPVIVLRPTYQDER